MTEMNTFYLGDETFVLPERGIRFTKLWKEKHIKPLIEMVYEMENINLSTSGGDVDLSDVSGFLRDIRPLIDQLVDVDELIVNAVIEWIMPTGEDVNYLLDNVAPRAFIAPLKWIVSEIYPLAELMRLMPGSPAGIGTPSSSPSLNGAGAKKKRRKGN